MKKSLYIYVFLFIGTALFASCGNNSEDPDDSPLVINIPEDDDECCSYDDELAMRRLFADYQEVDDLSGIIFDKYTIRVYARYATLRVGYTELLFAVEKTATNQHVKDIQISDKLRNAFEFENCESKIIKNIFFSYSVFILPIE